MMLDIKNPTRLNTKNNIPFTGNEIALCDSVNGKTKVHKVMYNEMI